MPRQNIKVVSIRVGMNFHIAVQRFLTKRVIRDERFNNLRRRLPLWGSAVSGGDRA
jgi:hypothetical protein